MCIGIIGASKTKQKNEIDNSNLISISMFQVLLPPDPPNTLNNYVKKYYNTY